MKFGTCIRGVGHFLPDEVRTNDWWPKEVVEAWSTKQKGVLNRLGEAGATGADFIHPYLKEALDAIAGDPFTGLKERRVAPPDMFPSDMEVIAAREAMRCAGVGPDDIDVLMTFSGTPDQVVHSNAPRVHHELGLTKAYAFGANAICFSMSLMMSIAHQFISSGAHKYALLVTSVKFSNILDYTTSMSVQSGDGAAAFVMGPCREGEGVNTVYARTESRFHDALAFTRRHEALGPRAPFAFGPNQNQDRIMYGAVKPQLAAELVSRIPYWAEEAGGKALQAAGWTGADVDVLITNAATAWYSPIVARCLGINKEAIEDNTHIYGNLAGGNLPMNTYTAWKKGRLEPGKRVLFFGHGAGASFGALTFVCPAI